MKRLSSGIALLLLAAMFVVVIGLSNLLFSGAKIDLTEDGLHTLSDGTKAVLNNLEEPVTLRFYYSQAEAQDNPVLRSRGRQIIDMLKEFQQHGGDKLTVELIYPEPFSDEALQAAGFGLQPIGVGQYNTPIYMGIVATNSLDSRGTISQLNQQSAQGSYRDNAEYDVAKLVYELSHPEKRTIGVITGLQMLGVPGVMPTDAETPPWLMVQFIEQLFEIDNLGPSPTTIPDDIDALWIVHPKDLPDGTLFAIDQYILNGGPTLIFVDPLAEADAPQDQFGMGAARSSDLNQLFKAWGVAYDANQVVLDRQYAMPEAGGHPAFLRLLEDATNPADIITADMGGRVNMGLVGSFNYIADDVVAAEQAAEHTAKQAGSADADSDDSASTEADIAEFTPLLYSSDASKTVMSSALQFTDPAQLGRDIQSGSERLVLAARLAGPLDSAFEKAPEGLDVDFKASGNAQVMLVADVDLLSDRLWFQSQQTPDGQLVPVQRWASNDAFVIGALGNFTGGSDLLNIRTRTTHRSFEVIEEAQREAMQVAQVKQEELLKRKEETVAELNRLLSEAASQTGQLDSAALEAQIQQARLDEAEFEREINKLNYELVQQHENRRIYLMALTMFAVPSLLILIAIVVGIRRANARASKQIV